MVDYGGLAMGTTASGDGFPPDCFLRHPPPLLLDDDVMNTECSNVIIVTTAYMLMPVWHGISNWEHCCSYYCSLEVPE